MIIYLKGTKMKNLLMGFILGIVLIFSLGTISGSSKYKSTLANQTGTPYYLYAVLDTNTGKTQVTLLNTAPRTIGASVNDPPLVLKAGIINADGTGVWNYACK